MFGTAFAGMTMGALVGCAHAPASPQAAGEPTRSFHMLVSGNGHGFELFDENKRKLVAFLDHPYRYLRAPEDRTQDGPERRNLLEDFSLGFQQGATVHWLESSALKQVGYLRESNVIEADAGPSGKAYFYAPFGLEKNSFIALAKSDAQAPAEGAVRLGFRLGANAKSKDFWSPSLDIVKIPGERLEPAVDDETAWILQGRGHGAILYVALSNSATLACRPSCAWNQVDADLRMKTTDGWFGVLVAYEDDVTQTASTLKTLRTWLAGRKPAEILDDSLSEWERWRKTPTVHFRSDEERRLWRQNEAVLRMAQVREPNILEPDHLRTSHGMILASLPPGSWATGWVRDGSYSTVALARMGHWAEAKASLNFFLNAQPVGEFRDSVHNADYRISLTRYYGSGEEEADYSGQRFHNVEMDDWGLFLWAVRQYLDASGDVAWLSQRTRDGSVYEAILNGVARPIEQNIEPETHIMYPDTSIWEANSEPPRHFAFTTLMAARGLADFAAIARKAGRSADAEHYAQLAKQVRSGFEHAFASPIGLLGSIERSPDTDIDGALVEAFTLGVLEDPKGPLAQKTLQNLERLHLAQGGYKRNGGKDAYEVNEWIFVDLRLASAFYRLAGESAPSANSASRAAREEYRQRADALIERNVRRATPNFHLLPEEYNDIPSAGPIGDYTGAIPMVGYGSGVFTLSLLDRESLKPMAN